MERAGVREQQGESDRHRLPLVDRAVAAILSRWTARERRSSPPEVRVLDGCRGKWIGIDDPMLVGRIESMNPQTPSPRDLALRFTELYRSIYDRFHRRDRADCYRLTPESRGILVHLDRSGPLTVMEAAKHFDRSQSAMSELLVSRARASEAS